jgi:hypothetical protein
LYWCYHLFILGLILVVMLPKSVTLFQKYVTL